MSRLWASTAAEPRRILTARRLEMWPRRFAWLHLDFSCRCAAQFHSKEFAVGAMPRMRAVEPGRAGPTAVLICMVQAWWKPSPRPACVLSCALAVRRPSINAERLAADLLQQVVDERASEHVEKAGSKPSMDA